MFNTDNIIPKEVKLLDSQIDIILRSLELYAFNLHNTWGISLDDNLNELRNALLFHTYESLLSQKNGEYKIAYDIIGEYKLKQHKKILKKKLYFKNTKNIA